jgi:DoxX-like family
MKSAECCPQIEKGATDMNTTSKQTTKRNTWAIRILTALVILPFAGGIMKVIQAPTVVEGFAHTGLPHWAIVPLGIIELSCLALYLIPRTTILGTLLLTGYLGGAVLANLINGTDFIHALVVGLIVWAGAWFRVPELRTLLPIRKTIETSPARELRAETQVQIDALAA